MALDIRHIYEIDWTDMLNPIHIQTYDLGKFESFESAIEQTSQNITDAWGIDFSQEFITLVIESGANQQLIVIKRNHRHRYFKYYVTRPKSEIKDIHFDPTTNTIIYVEAYQITNLKIN